MRHSFSIRNIAEYLLALAILKSLEWAPFPVAYRLARCYMRVVDLALPRLRRAARRNLALALPELGQNRHSDIIDGVFVSLARLLVTFAKLPSMGPHNIKYWIRPEGYEHYEAARRAGRGVLFATAHLGNWELSAYAHAYFAGPMNVVVRPLDNPLIDSLVERRRAIAGNRSLSKRYSTRAILKALRANEAVGILVDQNFSDASAVFVDFFGLPASTAAGVVRLATRTGAAVIPGFALWSDAERRYVLRLYPPIPITGDAGYDMQVLHRHLEAVIREHPDQWLWIHRRWKTRPPGSPPLYSGAPTGAPAPARLPQDVRSERFGDRPAV